MEWTVNDGLYHRFLKWKLKCENILDCKLAVLPESKKCKKAIAWSGDFGVDQYASRCLPMDDLRLDTIWSKCEEFCKPKVNEVGARFDLLTGFCHSNRSVDEWYNAEQAQVCLAKYPPETANILHHGIFFFFFFFFLKHKEFVSKTINDSNVDFDKYPAIKSQAACKEDGSI